MAAPIIAQYNELQQLLCLHAMRYPLMEPTDAVKLIYQNEFGSGHLIRDHFACRFHLYGEYASVAHNDALPLWEPIGNGILRVNLGALQPRQLEPVYHGFLATSTAHTGSHHSFLGKLEVLSGLAGENCFAFSKAELLEYLTLYIKSGCPAVSHSRAYREAYHPAYRIIQKEYMGLF